jgi:Glycosyl hydrolases family 39
MALQSSQHRRRLWWMLGGASLALALAINLLGPLRSSRAPVGDAKGSHSTGPATTTGRAPGCADVGGPREQGRALPSGAGPGPPAAMTPDTPPEDPGPVSRLRLGVTHTQHTADPWNGARAVACAERVLAQQPLLQNQHIMGWGARNPEPAPGVFDFSSLDRRLDLIRRTRGIPVITLCCAPDWMKGGRPGTTDWSRLEVAPEPAHYGDFASLARRIAERYPDVRYYQVWNELKGFWDRRRNRWDHERYTELYNLVYDALKAVNPAIQVGGPYVVADSFASSSGNHRSMVRGPWGTLDQRALDAVSYWLAHKHGADFVTVDAGTGTKDAGINGDAFAATEKISAVAAWVRQRTTLPLWWAEWHVLTPGAAWSQRFGDAVMTVSLIRMVESGSSAALLWGPQAKDRSCAGCLWSDTRIPGGGQSTPFLSTFENFVRWFPPGTEVVASRSSAPKIQLLASSNATVLVNTAGRPVTSTVGGTPVTLHAYEVRWILR